MNKFKFTEAEKATIGDLMYGPVGTDTIDYFIAEIEQILSERDGWISVEDGGAIEGEHYIVSDGEVTMGTCRIFRDGQFCYATGIDHRSNIKWEKDESVRYFKPLPSLPKTKP